MNCSNKNGQCGEWLRRVAISLVGLGLFLGAHGVRAQDLDALVKAAKAEGELTYYVTVTENIAKRVGDAFFAKYGIKTQYLRLSSGQVLPRYSAEAEAGKIVADWVIGASVLQGYAEAGIRKGWVEAIGTSALPVLKNGDFPTKFNRGGTAIIQVAPWLIAYNTEKLAGANIPRDWPDLLKPQYKGQILISDPRISEAYVDFWGLLLDRYGEGFFTQLRAQNPRLVATGVQAVQGLGAGEGVLVVPAVGPQVQATQSKGAPLASVQFDFTTGVETQLMLTASNKAMRPNAARLFANYLMSREGNKVFNDDPGSTSVYDSSGLPRQYEAPKPGAATARMDRISGLLGVK